jgi:hypothetical protein
MRYPGTNLCDNLSLGQLQTHAAIGVITALTFPECCPLNDSNADKHNPEPIEQPPLLMKDCVGPVP